MPDYLNTPFDITDESLASASDEVSVWSYPFGETILANVRLRPGITALDIGFGTGFPLLELAGRLGKTSTVYGIDLWRAAQGERAIRLWRRQYPAHPYSYSHRSYICNLN